MVKALVVQGMGIGCQQEVAHALQQAGAETELVHINSIFSAQINLANYQIINFCGGFLYGDLLGSGMCAANQLDLARFSSGKSVKEALIEFARKGGTVYGQCNGFQLLVKLGLLPGIDGDYSRQPLTLSHNDCGSYRVDYVAHRVESNHFAFSGLEGQVFHLWCRHGEGKIEYYREYGSVDATQAAADFEVVRSKHVLLRYANQQTGAAALSFPDNPNGSVDAIAGLQDGTGYIFGHMAHPEVSVYSSRSPGWFSYKDALRRKGHAVQEYDHIDIGSMIFRNIVNIYK
jgi:phosphoribosylformylglycinamidine (FGAM) synthase-like amidotransferase family enzyme